MERIGRYRVMSSAMELPERNVVYYVIYVSQIQRPHSTSASTSAFDLDLSFDILRFHSQLRRPHSTSASLSAFYRSLNIHSLSCPHLLTCFLRHPRPELSHTTSLYWLYSATQPLLLHRSLTCTPNSCASSSILVKVIKRSWLQWSNKIVRYSFTDKVH